MAGLFLSQPPPAPNLHQLSGRDPSPAPRAIQLRAGATRAAARVRTAPGSAELRRAHRRRCVPRLRACTLPPKRCAARRARVVTSRSSLPRGSWSARCRRRARSRVATNRGRDLATCGHARPSGCTSMATGPGPHPPRDTQTLPGHARVRADGSRRRDAHSPDAQRPPRAAEVSKEPTTELEPLTCGLLGGRRSGPCAALSTSSGGGRHGSRGFPQSSCRPETPGLLAHSRNLRIISDRRSAYGKTPDVQMA